MILFLSRIFTRAAVQQFLTRDWVSSSAVMVWASFSSPIPLITIINYKYTHKNKNYLISEGYTNTRVGRLLNQEIGEVRKEKTGKKKKEGTNRKQKNSDLSSTVYIITLNFNGLKVLIKRQSAENSKTQLHTIYKS